MREVVILSGKGGTGKTSLTASFAALSNGSVFADCDVDASNLHMLLSPNTKRRGDFRSGYIAQIRSEDCIKCSVCVDRCRFGAIKEHDSISLMIDPGLCEGCGLCLEVCPQDAISFSERLCGEWMVSETPYGTLVHAKLAVSGENSGKLVHLVRETAKDIAGKESAEHIIVDGPPGIGCPAISTLTGADWVVFVAEPTVSGEHDLVRALELAKRFNVPTALCVNKWDLNKQMTEHIENAALDRGTLLLGRICYDREVTAAQRQLKPAVETASMAGRDMKIVWRRLLSMMQT